MISSSALPKVNRANKVQQPLPDGSISTFMRGPAGPARRPFHDASRSRFGCAVCRDRADLQIAEVWGLAHKGVLAGARCDA